jgi:hypothetical protein
MEDTMTFQKPSMIRKVPEVPKVAVHATESSGQR